MKIGDIIAGIFVAACCTASFFMGRQTACPPVAEVVTRVRIDTVRIETPRVVVVRSTPIRVTVPRVLFIGRDTIAHSAPGSPIDSLSVAIEEETIEYRDSLCVARIVGPAIGDLHPRLESLELYTRTRFVEGSKQRRHRWFAVTAGVGVAYTPRGFAPVVGVQAGVVLWSR